MTFGWLPAARELCTLPGVFSNPPQGKIRLLFRGALLAVITSVLIPVLLDASFRPLAPSSLVLYGLFVVYGVVMMHGVGWAKAVLPSAWAGLFFGAMLGLFAVFYFVANPSYTVWILAMPVVSLAAGTVRLRWAILVAVAFLAVQAGFLMSLHVEWRAISTSTISWSVGMVFTLACTELAVWANASRERAEQLTHELEVANAELRSAAEQTAALAAATERNRIARDIHDGLGHYLTVVAVQLQAARALLPAQPERAADGSGGIASPGGGFGLAGLRERLAAVGGSLSAGCAPEGGFRLRAEVAA